MLQVSLQHAGQSDRAKGLRSCSGIFERYRVDRYNLFQDDYSSRKDIPALPFSSYTNVVQQPKSKYFPKTLKTIGDHIRAWRIDNKLFQTDIAKLLGVCDDTVVGWEMRNHKPTVKQMPGIIQLIGYLPIEIDTSTFAGKIAMYRYKHGLTPKNLGLLLSADASTVRAWEGGKNTPHKSRLKDIEEALHLNKLQLEII